MKKGFSIISVLLVVLFLLSGCSSQQPKDDLNNYNRVGTEGNIVDLYYPDGPMNWDQIFENSDIVAIVEVQSTEAIHYLENDTGSTIFRGSIQKIYKNDINYQGETLLFSQFGTPRVTIVGFPLYKVGDVFLLGFKVSEESYGLSETVFNTLENERAVFQLFEYEDVEYVLCRYAHEYFPETITACDATLAEKVWGALHESDPLVFGGGRLNNYVYLLDDVNQYMEELKQ